MFSVNKKLIKKKKYICAFCDREYLDQNKYELHKRSHIFTYTCKESGCRYESPSKTQLVEHQKTTGHKEVTATTVSVSTSYFSFFFMIKQP